MDLGYRLASELGIEAQTGGQNLPGVEEHVTRPVVTELPGRVGNECVGFACLQVFCAALVSIISSLHTEAQKFQD